MAELDKEHNLCADDKSKIAQSEQRVSQQRNMVLRLEAHHKALEASLEKTMRKYDEVTSAYEAIQAEHGKRQPHADVARGEAEQIENVLAQVKDVATHVKDGEARLEALRDQ